MDQNYTMKIKEIEISVVKLQEEGEGRDGLILQQNQDVTSLFELTDQTNQALIEYKEQFEKIE